MAAVDKVAQAQSSFNQPAFVEVYYADRDNEEIVFASEEDALKAYLFILYSGHLNYKKVLRVNVRLARFSLN